MLIDGVPITPDLYAGRAPSFPGTDEILLTLPNDVSTGCRVSLQVVVNGQISNPSTLSIASGSDNACTAPGITTEQLARLDQGGKYTAGSLAVAGGVDVSASTRTRVDTAGAIFVSLNADGLTAGNPAPPVKIPNNSCVVTRHLVVVPTVIPKLRPSRFSAPERWCSTDPTS